MGRHFTRFIKSIRVFGVVSGVIMFFYYVAHRVVPAWKWKPRQVRLGGVSRPIWLRPGVSDWIVMERIFLDREYDPIAAAHEASLDHLQQSLVAQGRIPLIIDCGANIGLSAVWFSERFPQATVIAVEPEPDNYRILCLNAANFPKIIPKNVAVSDRLSNVMLSNEHDTPWAWQTREVGSGGVGALTIPHLIESDGRCVPFVVKIDIEGFETSLFRSNTEWLASAPLLVFEMHDWMLPWSGSGHAFLSALTREKRDYLIRGENIFAYSHDALRNDRGVGAST